MEKLVCACVRVEVVSSSLSALPLVGEREQDLCLDRERALPGDRR